ncbi:hypothetical protein CVV70_21170 [Ralstonia solanacearum]|nr:hypothetical protein CVS51_20960 [Ralstonia solanacearum]PNQ34124.1 hypothetical protein CVV71_20170 [Ralstonia solanacearum]PNQ36400.1 hypothetical protein CVT21_22045 [Ralstonia solanacearum]PNQ42668.1 hypothetical protein CVT22_14020 [Ralstonia solanacearum]PNQ45520.1 hypothetical protein CVV70_21170 [Ralstonia solanacearum]
MVCVVLAEKGVEIAIAAEIGAAIATGTVPALTPHANGEAQRHRRSIHRQSGHSISIDGTRE